jgi:hypothetical protein
MRLMFTLVAKYQKGGQIMSDIRNTATWGNLDIADSMSFGNKEDYERFVDMLESWDEALEEDKDRNPDICDWSDTANVGYGPDEIMKCGHKAIYLVTFDSYTPETDTWDNIRLDMCGFHAGSIKSDIYGSSDKDAMMRNWFIITKTDSASK